MLESHAPARHDAMWPHLLQSVSLGHSKSKARVHHVPDPCFLITVSEATTRQHHAPKYH